MSIVGIERLQRQEIFTGAAVVGRWIDNFGKRVRQRPAAIDVFDVDFIAGFDRRIGPRKSTSLTTTFSPLSPLTSAMTSSVETSIWGRDSVSGRPSNAPRRPPGVCGRQITKYVR